MDKQAAAKQLQKTINLSKLTRNQARVEIAKDVLARLAAKKIVVKTGTYLQALDKDGMYAIDIPTTTGKELGKMSCQVCAVGAAFLSVASRQNCDIEAEDDEGGMWYDEMLNQLTPFFSLEELAEIETAFEHGSCSNIADEHGFDENVDAANFCADIEDDEAMIKIMNGIIKNKGKLPW